MNIERPDPGPGPAYSSYLDQLAAQHHKLPMLGADGGTEKYDRPSKIELSEDAKKKAREQQAERRRLLLEAKPLYTLLEKFQGMTLEQVDAWFENPVKPATQGKGGPVRKRGGEPGGKTGQLLAAVRRPEGATLKQICEASGFDERNAKTTINILRSRKAIFVDLDKATGIYKLRVKTS